MQTILLHARRSKLSKLFKLSKNKTFGPIAKYQNLNWNVWCMIYIQKLFPFTFFSSNNEY